MLRWNGNSWSIDKTPDASGTPYDYLLSVACPSTTTCFAVGHNTINNVGSNDQALIERWDGSAWRLVPAPNTTKPTWDDLNSVVCSSPSACWAVGSASYSAPQALMERWNGSSWTVAAPASDGATPYGALNGVSCASGADCWAVGDPANSNAALIEHWNGTSWSPVSSPSIASSELNLHAVKCTSASDCWAVGYWNDSTGPKALAEHWNGNSWTLSSLAAQGGQTQLSAIDCRGTGECWAVGSTLDSLGVYHTLTEHWDGWNWFVDNSPDVPWSVAYNPYNSWQGSMLSGIACVSASECLTAGAARGDDNIPITLVEQNTTSNAPEPLAITTTSLPAGTVGAAYSATLAAIGGAHPYTWSTVSGRLPSGLALDQATGLISGTPLTRGSSTFTVQAADHAGSTSTQSLTISIAA